MKIFGNMWERSGCRNRNGPESGAANIDPSIESTLPAYQKQQLHPLREPNELLNDWKSYKIIVVTSKQKKMRIQAEGCKLIDLSLKRKWVSRNYLE